ncbi:MAG TPA: KamA family radical SAM protein [Pseudobdellovibrionaceae bacterium]|nr:KamA family radical SAM protein [Pseudobdellovibrionaceae bacterium]
MKFDFKRAPKPENIAIADWNNWVWQMQNAIKSFDGLAVSKNELFQVRTTPYYYSLSESPAIRKIFEPSPEELKIYEGDFEDPLGEKQHSPVSRIIHRYSDRVLFLISDTCSVYCRFCTRKHFTGQDQSFIKTAEYNKALEYIAHKKGLREVILSGGDPLTLSNSILDRVLFDLRKIDHIEIIRIATRMPVVCPMRIDQELLNILKKHKPIFLMTHFNHPDELTLEAAQSLESFVDHGVPVFNQMVLLNGINNHPAIIQALNRRLLYLRTKPYYMFQMDPSNGSHHFINSIEDSMEIQKELWGHLSGLALPHLSLDVPGIGGKTPLVPHFELNKIKLDDDSEIRTYKTYDDKTGQYHSPSSSQVLKPEVPIHYLEEWKVLTNSRFEIK